MLDITPNPQLNPQNTPEDVPKKVQEKPKNVFMEDEESGTKTVGIFTVIVLVIVLLTAGGLYFLKTQKTSQLATKTASAEELQSQLASSDLAKIDEQATRYSTGLKQLNSFISNSIDYNKLLTRLSALTPNGISLTSFSVDSKKLVKISGKTNDLVEIANFLASLQNAMEFSSVSLDQNTQNSDTTGSQYYTFTISANLETSKLSNNPTDKSNNNSDINNTNNNQENSPTSTPSATTTTP